MMVNQSKKVSKLADTIKGLNAAITSLTETIMSLQSSVTKKFPQKEITSNDTPMIKTVDDKNMNIVVYGIDESPPSTPKSDRPQSKQPTSNAEFHRLLNPKCIN